MQDNAAINPVSFLDMKASIGSIVLLWSAIERELTKRIEQLDDGKGLKTAYTLAQKIARWKILQSKISTDRPEHRDLLEEVTSRLATALELRNRITHGLVSISADPFGDHGNANLGTDLNGEIRKHTHSDLEHMMRVMWHLVSAIEGLSNAAKQEDPAKAERSYAGIRLNNLP